MIVYLKLKKQIFRNGRSTGRHGKNSDRHRQPTEKREQLKDRRSGGGYSTGERAIYEDEADGSPPHTARQQLLGPCAPDPERACAGSLCLSLRPVPVREVSDRLSVRVREDHCGCAVRGKSPKSSRPVPGLRWFDPSSHAHMLPVSSEAFISAAGRWQWGTDEKAGRVPHGGGLPCSTRALRRSSTQQIH